MLPGKFEGRKPVKMHGCDNQLGNKVTTIPGATNVADQKKSDSTYVQLKGILLRESGYCCHDPASPD